MKYRKRFGLLAVLLCFLLTAVGCQHTTQQEDPTQPPQGSETVQPPNTDDPSVPDSGMSAMYTVESATQLKKLTGLKDGDTVLMKGYHVSNDGGGGMFVWDEASTAQEDGGTVFAAGSGAGRFLRDCEPNYRNVKWFGAVGSGSSDDTGAIQAAIDSLPKNGGTVLLPGGRYLINQTIQIGNGDGANQHSTVNGIKLIGEGAGFSSEGVQLPTKLAAKVPLDTMISVNGKISDVVIQDMFIGGDNLAECGLMVQAASGLTVTDIIVGGTTKYGIKLLGGSGVGTENKFNRFETVSVYAVKDETVCVFMDGATTDVAGNSMSTFIDCRFDTAQTENSYSIWMRNTTGVDFYRCHFNTYRKSSVGLVLDATNCDGYPYGNVYYDCSIVSMLIKEDTTGSIGYNFFYGFGTYDAEEIPKHPKLSGITDTGIPFNL